MSDWHLYVACCADGSLYTGIARDVRARLVKHNTGRGSKSLRGKLPVTVVRQTKVGDYGDALSVEAAFKGLARTEKQQKVAQVGALRRFVREHLRKRHASA